MYAETDIEVQENVFDFLFENHEEEKRKFFFDSFDSQFLYILNPGLRNFDECFEETYAAPNAPVSEMDTSSSDKAWWMNYPYDNDYLGYDTKYDERLMFDIPCDKNSTVRVYIARIAGNDPVYNFDRRFLRRDCINQRNGNRTCKVVLNREGVYEVGIKWLNKKTKELFRKEVFWFAFFNWDYFPLEKREVLHTVYNIKAQTDFWEPD